MNRRNFCKTTTATLIMWGLNPVLVFANSENNILSGEFFINSKTADKSFNNLDDNIIKTKIKKAILKVKNNFY